MQTDAHTNRQTEKQSKETNRQTDEQIAKKEARDKKNIILYISYSLKISNYSTSESL